MCGWLMYILLLCDGLSSLSRKGKVWRVQEILKVPGCRTITNPFFRLAPTPTMSAARACYSGPSRKLVVALDIGTTFSGAAYAFLDPGQVPQIRSVTRYVLLPTPDLVIRDNEYDTGTSTTRILDPQRFPLYCITIATAISVVLRTGLISRIAMDCSG